MIRALLPLILVSLVVSACDSTEESPQVVPLVHGTYGATWRVDSDGPGDNRRTEVAHEVSIRITESGGAVTQFPGSAGQVSIARSLIDVNTGAVVNRLIREVDVRFVSGTIDTGSRTFDLQIEGDQGDYVFEATFSGGLGTTYTQLTGQMNGRLYHSEFPNEPTNTLVIDQRVTLQKQ